MGGKSLIEAKTLVALVLGAGLGAGTMLLLTRSPGGGLVDMKVGGLALKLDTKTDLNSLDTFMTKMEASPDAKAQFLGVLGNRKIFSLDGEALPKAIEGLDVHHPLAERLLDLQRRERGPFKRVLVKVRLGFPSNPGFPDENAVVCSGSDWKDQKVEIWDKQEQRSIVVTVKNTRPCNTTENGPELIQITPTLGTRLFGRRLGKFEEGWIGRTQ